VMVWAAEAEQTAPRAIRQRLADVFMGCWI
jgi:hypothetical protein